MDIYIYGYQVPDTRSCQVPDRARYQIVPGTRSARSCQVPDRARYLIVPGTRAILSTPEQRPIGSPPSWDE